MQILVTGGAGYIGSVVTEQLVQGGYDVIVFDSLQSGNRAAVHADATFVQGSLHDIAAIEQVFTAHRGIGCIIHCAGNALVGESWRQLDQYLHDNVTNGINLIATAIRFNVDRFILISTADVFGATGPVPIIEQASIFPSSPYGESLYMLERMLSWYDRITGLRYAVLRCFNVAGATEQCGEYHVPEAHLIPTLLHVALGKQAHFTLFGDDYHTPDGTCVRDYIHVVDVARAIIEVLPVLDKHSRTYNLGGGVGYSNKDVITMARRVTGHPIPYIVGRRRPFEPPVQIASITQIRREVGWEPQFSNLEHIMRTAWDWQYRHPNGY